MPATPNGRANGRDHNSGRVLRLGDLTPERIPVEAGPGRTLYAWVTSNQRYPASVAAELEDARNEYINSREPIYNGPPQPNLVEAARYMVAQVDAEGSVTSLDAVADAANALRRSLQQYDEQPQYRASAVQWEAYLTRCLLILIPGLEAWEADLLPSEQRLSWLFDLGYFTREQQQQQAPPEGDEQRPPEPGKTSTGVEPDPTLAGSTT